MSGGAGFLGSHLCETLLDRGDSVTCVDNLVTGREENLSHIRKNPRFTFLTVDVTDRDALDLALGDVPVDAVAHLASAASPPDYHRIPLETLLVGSRGTENMLELADRHGARFILASTSEVYGDPAVHPQREDYWGNVNPTGPRSVYDEAKRYAEAVTTAYGRSRGTNVGIVRIFNTYGPRMRAIDGRVVTSFIAQALNGDSLSIYGDGSQTRSFCYVDDLIRGLIALLDSTETGPVNIGNPAERTVASLAELIVALSGSQSEIEYFPLPIDDPTRRKPNIDLAMRSLQWSPRVGILQGLKQTIAWFASRPEEVRNAAPFLVGGQPDGQSDSPTSDTSLDRLYAEPAA
ncbi:NAD-dependent epimerase/dehydratase family protein [Cryobacterium frigoriphilum]|uniref:NAD-dependent epimerase/dehydratase family protein n=1 Tax=Cryobacterium frigoriphilum TaxID=1259150 RepID=UPI001F542FF1|nr:NAD-dependent epimerase/dehydratase family protein [Cryobacterium frigoriphilum]